jgi:hypothetical protein
MRKMFHDVDRWDKAWFRKLGAEGRDIWNWILDRSRYGIWEVDLERIEFELGYRVELEHIKKIFGNRLEDIGDGKVFIPAAVVFQYGQLSDACKPHVPVILELKRLNLFDSYQKELAKGLGNLEKKNKNKEEVKEQEKEPRESEGFSYKPGPDRQIQSAEDLQRSIPLVTRDKFNKLYSDPKWFSGEVEKCFDYHTADPATMPRTTGQWMKKLQVWLMRADEYRGDVPQRSLADVDLTDGGHVHA